MVLFAVFMLCPWVMGSDLVSSATLALGQQNPMTIRMRKFLSILGLQFLFVLLSYLFWEEEKRKKKMEGKHQRKRQPFFSFLVWT